MSKSTIYLIIAIVMAVIAGASLSCAYRLHSKPPIVQTDTLTFHDTIRLEKPTEIAAIPKGYELAPIGLVAQLQDKVRELVMLADSLEQHPQIIVRDSLVYVQIPIEQKIYEGKEYKAAVSGYKPTLDWIEVYSTTTTIKETPNNHSLFIEGNIGSTINVGIEYEQSLSKRIFLSAKSGYDFYFKQAYILVGSKLMVYSW